MGLIGATAKEINKTMGTGDGVARGFYIVCCRCGRADRVKINVQDHYDQPCEATVDCNRCGQKVRIY